jgi:hypothetical protein
MEQDNQLENMFNVSYDADARARIKSIAMWAKICALCAFAGYLFSLIVAIFGHVNYNMEAEGFSFGTYFQAGKSLIGVVITIVIGGAINYFLYKFGVDGSRGIENMDVPKLNEGLNSLRTYFKILGVLTIIVLGLVALGIIVFLISRGISSH